MLKVLYFSTVNIGSSGNGGSLCCRSHVRELAADPSIDLVVSILNVPQTEDEIRRFLSPMNLKLHFFPMIRGKNRKRGLRNFFEKNYGITYEEMLGHYSCVDGEFQKMLASEKPDIVVVDYLPSAFFLPSLLTGNVPSCVITLNREADYHRELYFTSKGIHKPLIERIAFRRWTQIENKIHSQVDGLIALTENDLPHDGSPPGVKAVIHPFLEFDLHRWKFRNNRQVSFVGRVAHYPNRVAIEWICTQLCPAVAARDESIKFRIIGAAAEDVPPSWRHPSVEFLGDGTRAQVELQFTHGDLFIAPIANNYGSKIKLLECISYGTPFMATRNAMSGLSYLQGMPLVDLDDPEGTGQRLCDLMEKDGALQALSESIRTQTLAYRKKQEGQWSRVLNKIVGVASGGSVVDAKLRQHGEEKA